MSRFSVKKPYTVIVAVIIVLVLGFQAFTRLSTDLLPSMNLPYAVVVTTYAGANPETVETVVTEPVESSMATISNIKNITSVSSENYSMVVLEFNQDANMDSVTIDMRESLDMLESYWPDEVGSPIIMKINPDMMPIMMVAVDRDDMTIEDISDFVNQTLISEMESIDGVASVTASGLLESSLQVELSQDKINKLNEKLMSNLDTEFDEARQEIEDGKAELESGKAALDEQSQSFTQQMADASSKITDGKITMSEKEADLKASLKEMEAGEKELDEKEKELQSSKEKLEANEETMLKLEQQLQNLQNEIETQKVKLEELNQQLTVLQEDPEGNAEQIAALEAEIQTLETAITTAETGMEVLKEQGISVGGTEAAKQQIAAGQAVIDQTRAQLTAGKAQIQAALQQIEKGKETLSAQESQLHSAQASAAAQLDDARIQIITGRQQLENASVQLEDSVDAAKEQADLGGIITKDMVSNILMAQNFSMPAGYVTEDGVDYLVRIGDELSDQEELENLVLFDLSDYDMGVVTLKDVADVTVINNSDENYAKINGNDGIILSLEKQNGYSTADVAKKIRAYMEDAAEEYEGLHITTLMDQGIYIDMVVESVLQNLVIGAILAVIVLFFFLKDWKPTLTVAVSIPISVVFAIVLMYFTGITMNIISLSGLALGVGMLVDNAIVVIENIHRLRAEGMTAKDAAITGAKQVSGAIIASTLTTICIWVPIIFAEGLTRQLFVELVLTIAFSLIASLVVALTVVPMASSKLLVKTKEIRHPFFDRMTSGYGRLLKNALKHRLIVLVCALLLLVVSAGMLLSKGFEFMGETDSSQISISVTMPEDSLFDETAAMSDTIIERISSIEDVDTVGAIMGSGLSAMGSYSGTDTESVTMYVILKDDRTRSSQEISREIADLTDDLECEVSVSASSMDMSSLGGSGVSVMIKGPELDQLIAIASDFADILEGVEGTVEVSDGMENPTPELRITIDKNKAMEYGLTVAQIYQEIYGRIAEAKTATTLTVNNRDYPIIVVEDTDESLIREDIRNYEFTITRQNGDEEKIKLSDIAVIQDSEGLSAIRRDNQQRYMTVSAGIDDAYNVTLVTNEFADKLKDYDMPDGYSYEMSGENETIMESMEQLIQLLLVGILIMYLIMVAQFQSLLSPFIVLFTIPLAFTGGFLALLLTGNIISIIGMVGFIMLCGIIVNNGIVFIDYTNQLRESGMSKKDALIETGKTRLRPILMTAMTTILAMSTMALGMGDGTDMVQPMAIVTIGGLVYGTFMTLFVVPCIYDLFMRERKIKSREEE